jgi:hypothetical protein
MSWITWVAVLVAWPLVGLAVAYFFGRFTHRGELYGNAAHLLPPVVSYLRRGKRDRVARRAAAAPTKVLREAAGRYRVH